MILLSIDSGLEKTGYAILNHTNTGDPRLVVSGLIVTPRKAAIEDRVKQIFDKLNTVITKYNPDTIVIERLFFFKNQKTVIGVSQTQGVIMLLCGIHKIKLEFLTPLQIKQIITGYGQADKKSIQKMLKLTLGIDIPSKRDDEADAIACGLAYCYLNKNLIQ